MNRICGEKIKINDLSFNIPWILLVTNTIIAQSYLSKFSMRAITIVCIIALLCRIIWISKFRKYEIVYIVLFGMLGLIISIVSKDNRMLWLAITLSASINTDFYKLIKLTFKIVLIEVLLIVTSCLLLYGNIGTSLKGGLALGMGHPNILHGIVTILCSMFIYIKYDRLNAGHILLIEQMNFFIYLFTFSRTGFISVSVTLLMVLLYKIFPTKYLLKFIAVVTMIMILIFTMIPIFYQHFPNSKWLILFDNKLTGRLWQSRWYYRMSGIKFFGNYFEELNKANPYALLDMGFFRLLIEYGILAYLLIIFGYLGVIWKAIRNNDVGEFFLSISMMVFTCIESLGTYVFFNITFLSFGMVLFKNNSKKAGIYSKKDQVRRTIKYDKSDYIYFNI